MNKTLFESHTSLLLHILDSLLIPDKEKQYRRDELCRVYDSMLKSNRIENRYYALSHEIRSSDYLKDFPCFELALDSQREPGCDIRIYDNYKVECVCSGMGDVERNGLDKCLILDELFDYRKKEDILLTRLTSSIKTKKEKYDQYLLKGIVDKRDRYIIFLGLGPLATELFSGENGFVMNKILFGVDCPQIYINISKNRVEGVGYTYRKAIIKKAGTLINCNLFDDLEYSMISGILFTTADLTESYTNQNTFLFVNPNARNRINVNRFKDIIYWKEFNNSYQPRKKGKLLRYDW